MDVTYTVENGTTAVITCNIQTLYDYPTWLGPPNVNGVLRVYNIVSDPTFFTNLVNYARLSWADNKKDLILSDVVRQDEGKYQCAEMEKWTVQLNVRGKGSI